jgi:hypothetical protein
MLAGFAGATANLKRLRSYRERTPWPESGIL